MTRQPTPIIARLRRHLPALLAGTVTQAEIARRLNCSRERIRQLLVELGQDQSAKDARKATTKRRNLRRALIRRADFVAEMEPLRAHGELVFDVTTCGLLRVYIDGVRVRLAVCDSPWFPNGSNRPGYYHWNMYKRDCAYVLAVDDRRFLIRPPCKASAYLRVDATEPPNWCAAMWTVASADRRAA